MLKENASTNSKRSGTSKRLEDSQSHQRRHQLLKQLFEKFSQRYNPNRKNRLIEYFIDKSLRDFLKKEDLSTRDLDLLEKRISQYSKMQTNALAGLLGDEAKFAAAAEQQSVTTNNNVSVQGTQLIAVQENEKSSNSQVRGTRAQQGEATRTSASEIDKVHAQHGMRSSAGFLGERSNTQQLPQLLASQATVQLPRRRLGGEEFQAPDNDDAQSVRSSASRFHQSQSAFHLPHKNLSEHIETQDENFQKLQLQLQQQQQPIVKRQESSSYKNIRKAARLGLSVDKHQNYFTSGSSSALGLQQQYGHALDDTLSTASSTKTRSVVVLGKEKADEWAAIVKYDTNLFTIEEERKKKSKEERKKFLQQQLEKQVHELEIRKKAEQDKEQNFVEIEKKQIQTLQDKELLKQLTVKSQNSKLKSELNEQLQQKKSKEKIEQKIEKKIDAQLVDRFAKEKQQEAQSALERKLREREYMHKVWVESLQEKQAKLDSEKNFKELEQAQFAKYGQVLEQLDRRRNEELDELHKLQTRVLNRWDGHVEFEKSKRRAKESEQEEAIQRQMKEIEAREKNIEHAQVQLQQRLKQQMMQENARLLMIKQQQEEEERNQDKRQGDIWRKQDQEYWAKIAQDKAQRDEVRKLNLQELVKQMEWNEKVKKYGLMSKQDLLLNKQLLKRIAEAEGTESQFKIINAEQVERL